MKNLILYESNYILCECGKECKNKPIPHINVDVLYLKARIKWPISTIIKLF